MSIWLSWKLHQLLLLHARDLSPKTVCFHPHGWIVSSGFSQQNTHLFTHARNNPVGRSWEKPAKNIVVSSEFISSLNLQLVDWWFGSRWFGFLGFPYERDCYLGVPLESQTTNCHREWLFHQLSWAWLPGSFGWLTRASSRWMGTVGWGWNSKRFARQVV